MRVSQYVLRAEVPALEGRSLPLLTSDSPVHLQAVAEVAGLRGLLGDADIVPLMPGMTCPCALLHETFADDERWALHDVLDALRVLGSPPPERQPHL
jgi:hypothetical protein